MKINLMPAFKLGKKTPTKAHAAIRKQAPKTDVFKRTMLGSAAALMAGTAAALPLGAMPVKTQQGPSMQQNIKGKQPFKLAQRWNSSPRQLIVDTEINDCYEKMVNTFGRLSQQPDENHLQGWISVFNKKCLDLPANHRSPELYDEYQKLVTQEQELLNNQSNGDNFNR